MRVSPLAGQVCTFPSPGRQLPPSSQETSHPDHPDDPLTPLNLNLSLRWLLSKSICSSSGLSRLKNGQPLLSPAFGSQTSWKDAPLQFCPYLPLPIPLSPSPAWLQPHRSTWTAASHAASEVTSMSPNLSCYPTSGRLWTSPVAAETDHPWFPFLWVGFLSDPSTGSVSFTRHLARLYIIKTCIGVFPHQQLHPEESFSSPWLSTSQTAATLFLPLSPFNFYPGNTQSELSKSNCSTRL